MTNNGETGNEKEDLNKEIELIQVGMDKNKSLNQIIDNAPTGLDPQKPLTGE